MVPLAALVAATSGAPALAAEPASGRSAGGEPAIVVDVIEVSGLLDPINVDFIAGALDEAVADGSAVLVVRLDSTGAVVPAADLASLVERVSTSPVPVAVWVGPGKEARATGGAYDLFEAAAIKGVAPRARVGDRSAEEALEGGDADVSSPTLGDFIVALGDEGVDVPTTVVERDGRPPQQELAEGARVRFDEPSLLAQLLHAVATPSAAYLLLVVGLLLVVFEFFTAGVGVAGGVGAAGIVLAGYGLGVLPTRPWALAILGFAILGYAVDVQAGAPRAWTAIGTAAFVVGSFFLFGDGFSVPLVVLAIGIAGVALFMVAGMPAMVRTRFSTPTIGRESMLGEEGLASTDVAPDGVVTVRDAPWRARTNRATPIRAGDPVRVAAIDGLLLEVEPLEGAAKDAGH
ncbi:MAG TPA: NfeD family protein [Acidimicrobiales bacterium]|nr:NfeD family protein [Acidimicrobiales bacterium]